MNVTGMRPDAGFYRYNSNRIEELRTQQLAAEKAAGKAQEAQQAEDLRSVDAAPQVHTESESRNDRAAQTGTAYDYAQLYQPDATYEMKGATSDLGSLDVAKAVSDLSKDQILQQYQFFVGGQPQLGAQSLPQITPENDPEGQVLTASRTMENFTL